MAYGFKEKKRLDGMGLKRENEMSNDIPPTAHDIPPTAHDIPPTAHDIPPTAHDILLRSMIYAYGILRNFLPPFGRKKI